MAARGIVLISPQGEPDVVAGQKEADALLRAGWRYADSRTEGNAPAPLPPNAPKKEKKKSAP